MADHQFPPDSMGSFDDWSDFSVDLVDEQVGHHNHIQSNNTNNQSSLFSSISGASIRKNPSSVWKDDLLEQNIKRYSKGSIK